MIESLESLQVYKGAELSNCPVKLPNEVKFNNLICSLEWALDIEQADKMDLIMAKSMHLDLADELKTKFDTKIGYVYAEYQEKVESLITAL